MPSNLAIAPWLQSKRFVGRVAELIYIGRSAATLRAGACSTTSMKRKRIVVACLLLVVVGALWLFASSSPNDPSVILLGFTNNATGILTASYESSNVTHSGFAIFRAENLTAHDFL